LRNGKFTTLAKNILVIGRTQFDVPVLNASAFTYNTYKPSSSFQLFDESTLPTTITGFNGFVTRRDVAE
jgi:hypothetical protein